MSLDFSDDGRFPATIEVVLGNGYRYKQSATDDEAHVLIAELQERVIEYEEWFAAQEREDVSTHSERTA